MKTFTRFMANAAGRGSRIVAGLGANRVEHRHGWNRRLDPRQPARSFSDQWPYSDTPGFATLNASSSFSPRRFAGTIREMERRAK